MADDPTRTETVQAHIEEVLDKYGDENYMQMISVCVQDISESLALLVDGSTSSAE